MTKILLVSALTLVLNATVYANKGFEEQLTPLQAAPFPYAGERIPADLIVDLAHFSYSVNKRAWQERDHRINNRLIQEGWKISNFDGTTGGANSQVKSVSGFLAFKGTQVVIATRGTVMNNYNDWLTNFRIWHSQTDQFFGINGGVASGLLQTHLSSWQQIKQTIIQHAQSIGKKPSELQYTLTGHSKGAAKAQLNALSLLTDEELNIGVDYLEKSFITASELGEGDWQGLAKKTFNNKGNVDIVVFESPRVFCHKATESVNAILRKENVLRIENVSHENAWDFDPATVLAPEFLGFSHVGRPLYIDSGDTLFQRHPMKNVGSYAASAIEKHRQGLLHKPDKNDLHKALSLSAEKAINPVKKAEGLLQRTKLWFSNTWQSLWGS